MSSTTGSYVAIAGLLVAGLSFFNVIIPTDTAITIVAGIVALVGVVQQFMAHKSVVAQAQAAGVSFK